MLQPIVSQPNSQQVSEWMSAQIDRTNCPPGLEYLSSVDRLFIHQSLEDIEVFWGARSNNKYQIKNTFSQKVYNVVEEDNYCLCCGSIRAFHMKILDCYQREALHLYRPLRCQCSCCFCCLQRLEVSSPSGTIFGNVIQEWSLFTPKLRIENSVGNCVLRIQVCNSNKSI